MKTITVPFLLTRFSATFALTVLLAGCSSYSVSVNERTVYTPPPLLKDIPVSDKGLHDCLIQTIADHKVTNPSQLVQLNCTNAGISSIEGIQYFANLMRLNLAHNQIVDISPASLLPKLEHLQLKDNHIENLTPLKALTQLTRVDVSQNPLANCQAAKVIEQQVVGDVVLPETCRR